MSTILVRVQGTLLCLRDSYLTSRSQGTDTSTGLGACVGGGPPREREGWVWMGRDKGRVHCCPSTVPTSLSVVVSFRKCRRAESAYKTQGIGLRRPLSLPVSLPPRLVVLCTGRGFGVSLRVSVAPPPPPPESLFVRQPSATDTRPRCPTWVSLNSWDLPLSVCPDQ